MTVSGLKIYQVLGKSIIAELANIKKDKK